MQSNKKWWLGAAALSLALSAPMLSRAQADEKPADKPKTTKPKADKKPALNKRTKDMIESIMGAPLTAAQQEAIAQAAKEQTAARKAAEVAYKEKVAAALGITVAEYDAKDKVYRAKLKAAKAAKDKK